MIDAVKRGDRPAVRALVEKRIDVNVAEPDGTTPLHWAAHRSDVEIVDLLLRAGARAGAATDIGVTPLFLACENGNAAIVGRLLTAGANPNTTALANRVTPLMMAARTGRVESVRALIAQGADVNTRETAHTQTALMWAAAGGHSEVAKVLIDAGADVHVRTAVQEALVSRGNSAQRGAPLGQHVVSMPFGGFTPLLFAATQDDVETGRTLLRAGARVDDPAANGATPLVTAAFSDRPAMVGLLLQNGANVNAAEAGYTALHAAVLRGNPQVVAALLAHGANPNAPLTKGSVVRRLNKEYTFNEALVGATPLFLAAKYAESNIMRQLIAAAGDPFIRVRGTSLLMAAAGVGSGLDRRGRSLETGEVETALLQDEDDERAIISSGLKAVKLALDLGVDVNLVNDAGDTALHGAASHGFDSVVQLLSNAGAKLDVKNKRGQTPLALASREENDGVLVLVAAKGHRSTMDLLRKLGATQ